jgi:hypothetical protein
VVPADLSRMAWRRVLAAVAVGALLTACGGGGGGGDGDGDGGEDGGTAATTPATTAAAPDDLAATVAAATDAAGRARFTLSTVAVVDGEDVVAARSEGEVDWEAGQGHRVDEVDESLLTTGRPGSGLEPQGEVWLVGERTWEVDADRPGVDAHPVTPGVGSFVGLSTGEADESLEDAILAAVGERRFTVVGTEAVGGVETTRYRAGPAAGGDDDRTVELWADETGRLVRLRFGTTTTAAGRLAVVLELADLGGDVTVPPPPAGLI